MVSPVFTAPSETFTVPRGFGGKNSTTLGNPLAWGRENGTWCKKVTCLHTKSTLNLNMNLEVPAREDVTSVKKMLHSIPLFGLTKKKSGTSAVISPHSWSPLGSNVVHDFRNFWELSNKNSQPYRVRRFLPQPLHHHLTRTPWSPSLDLKSTTLRDLHPHAQLYGNSCLESFFLMSSRTCSPDQSPTKNSRHCPRPQFHQLACRDIPWKNCCECLNRISMGFRRWLFTSRQT